MLISRLKLNITQTEIARICGISQSEVSRLERGLVTPKDIPSFESVCVSYKLDIIQKDKYAELVLGRKSKTITNDLVPPLLKLQVNNILDLHKRGNPLLAYEQAKSLREWYTNNTGVITEKALEYISELILLESSCLWDTLPPEKAKKMTEDLLLLSYKLTTMSSSPVIKNNLLLNLGFRAYLQNNFSEAELHFSKVSLDKISGSKFNILRAQIVISGKNQNLKRLELLETAAVKLVSQKQNITNTEVAYLFEGLANAYSHINSGKAYLYIKKSIMLLNSESGKPKFWKLRYIQSSRTLSLIVKDSRRLKDRYFNTIVHRALKLCDEGGFIRHKQQILQSLKFD